MGLFTEGFFKRSSSGRRLAKREYEFQKDQARHAQQSAQAALELHKTESFRNRALLSQSLYGRGLGKSSIADQDMARLIKVQWAQRDSIKRQREMARKGYSLIKFRKTHAQRQAWAETLDAVVGIAGNILSYTGRRSTQEPASTGGAGMYGTGGGGGGFAQPPMY